MSSQIEIQDLKPGIRRNRKIIRLKIIGAVLTVFGIGLFIYLVNSVGFYTILEGIEKIGFGGFAVILLIYFGRICIRATAWKLSVSDPFELSIKDTIPAVIIGEAMSSMIPLGILVSGTSKAIAVKNRVPLVVGFSSVATENLFYSLATSTFIILGALFFLQSFQLDDSVILGIRVLIGVLIFLLFFGFLMVVRQWHIASAICEKIYRKGFLKSILENGRSQVRLFEDLIYGFYRKHSKRFLPIAGCQVLFHSLGIMEAWFILNRLTETIPSFLNAFLLESVSRFIAIVFKLIPFNLGVDEAASQFVTETLAIGAGVGITIAIIRKGRIFFWAAIGLILIIKREITFQDIKNLGASG